VWFVRANGREHSSVARESKDSFLISFPTRCLRQPFTPVELMAVINERLAECWSRPAGITRQL
jgi:hypothetical protein